LHFICSQLGLELFLIFLHANRTQQKTKSDILKS